MFCYSLYENFQHTATSLFPMKNNPGSLLYLSFVSSDGEALVTANLRGNDGSRKTSNPERNTHGYPREGLQ